MAGTKRHKMVSLCDASYEAAGRMNNFSGWVRTKVLQEATGSQETAVSVTSSRSLLAVVLARQQEKLGYDHEIVQVLLELLQAKELL